MTAPSSTRSRSIRARSPHAALATIALGLAAGTAHAQIQWIEETPASSPAARRLAVLIGDVNEGRAVLFGGLDATGRALGDTWLWNGTDWREAASRLSPSPRSGHAMTHSGDAGVGVLFGGLDSTGRVLDDTWTFDGSEWAVGDPQIRPPARHRHGMAHDEGRNLCIVFGGLDARGQALDDTWIFDGSRWTVGDPDIRPPARSGHAMFYDPATRGIIIIGGRDASGLVLDDMWIFDGSTYSVSNPCILPPARADAAVAHSPALGVALLFGGEDARGAPLGDTWIWDGLDWSIAAIGDVNDVPSPRSGHAMSVDPLRAEIVLFGGETGEAALAVRADTWTIPACGEGTVNAGAGSVASVLFVNGKPGAPGTREVEVATGESIDIRLATAPLGPPAARYAFWTWMGRPVRPLPLAGPGGAVLGCTVNPTPLHRGIPPIPIRCLRADRMPIAVCGDVPEAPSPASAPWSLRRQRGFSSPVILTLQGILEDRGAGNPTGFSVTNAVVLVVR